MDHDVTNVRLPNEVIRILDKSVSGKSIEDKVLLSLAIGMFVEQTVTLERAAELSGKPLANFIEILRSKGIPWMTYTAEHLKEDDQAIQKYRDDSKK